MNKENNKKLYLIKGPGYSFDLFGPQLDQIQETFESIIRSLNIFTASGNSVSIRFNIDVLNPERTNACAKRESQEPFVYKIRMDAGLSYCLWLASRAFAYDEFGLLPWIEQCTIDEELLKKLGKKLNKQEILDDLAYSISSYLIILHEISHVTLGHLDYLNEKMGLDYLSEFQDEKEEYSPDEIRIRKALEAEADRQAGQWLVGIFEFVLGKAGVGELLSFPSRLHAYEFYVYTVVNTFRVLQDLSQRKGVIHPKPNERLYILIGSVSKYFSQNLPDQHEQIYIHAVKSCLEAGRKLTLVDSYELLTVMQNAHNLAFVDDVLKEINISSYQHKFEVIDMK